MGKIGVERMRTLLKFVGSFFAKILLIVLIIAGTVSLTSAQIRLHENRRELEQLQQQKLELQKSNEALSKLLEDDSYDDLIHQALRENGYVRSDETVYTDIAGQ